jgi:hypothetical protein
MIISGKLGKGNTLSISSRNGSGKDELEWTID